MELAFHGCTATELRVLLIVCCIALGGLLLHLFLPGTTLCHTQHHLRYSHMPLFLMPHLHTFIVKVCHAQNEELKHGIAQGCWHAWQERV